MNTSLDMGHKGGILAFVAVATLLSAPIARADGIVAPVEEAPTTIFSTQLGSVDVDLTMLGSWTADVSFASGLLFVPGLAPQLLDSFPSLTQGFLFTQTPDLTVSLDIYKRFFLDVSVLGGFTNNSLQLGYKGQTGEVLQSVLLGNAGVTMDPTSLMQIPSQPTGSLGASAQLVSGLSTNDLLLRWDATTRKQKTFMGKNEVVQQVVPLNSYVRGMYFFLPDLGIDSSSVQLLIEDATGTITTSDGRHYRTAGYNDATVDPTLGTVTLLTAVKGRVLIYYTKSGAAVGTTAGAALPKDILGPPPTRDPSQSVPFSWATTYWGTSMGTRQVSVPGIGNSLLLWEPGDNSPFEMDNSYSFTSTPPTDVSRITYRLVATDTSASLSQYSALVFQSKPTEKRFMVLANQSLRATFANFYPFADPSGLLYGPDRDSLTGNLDFDIVAQFLNPVSDLILEANVVPGSVQMTINGVAETRFQVDNASGKLTLLTDVLPTDTIDVSYSVTQTGTTGGDVLLSWKDTIPFATWAALTLEAGVRWNANPWTYTQEAYSKSGTIMAGVGLQGSIGALTYSTEAAVAYTNPDTTGILRLFGMEGDSTSLSLLEDYAYPSASPTDAAGLFTGLGQTNRGKLYYRNYRSYGALGSISLETFETSPAPPQLAYATGNRMGPYNVLGSEGNTSTNSIVLEYDLASSQWVGTQLPVMAGSDVDLSGARSISIRVRESGQTGSVGVYLQLGSLSEDLDDTGSANGIIQAESSATDAGFPFVDKSNGVTLKVGAGPLLQGNSILDTEDRNGNGILDREDSTRVVTLPHNISETQIAPGTSWITYTFQLSDDDRGKLLQTRGVRIIVKETSGKAAATGAILVDALTVEGATFSPVTAASSDRTKISVRQIAEYLSPQDTGSPDRFETKFPTTYKLFHADASTNEVLETSWSSPASDFSVKGFTTQGTGGIQYQTIVSYVRSFATGLSYTFTMNDSSGPRIVWKVGFSDSSWHEVKVSRANGTVTVDGVAVGAPTQFDQNYGDIVSLEVSVPVSVASSGDFFLDEVYATDPAGSVGVAFTGTITAKLPGTLLSIATVPILSNLTAREDVSIVSAGFSPLYGIPSTAGDLSSRTEAEADVLFTHVKINLTMSDVNGIFTASGGHTITLPSAGSPITATDTFSLDDVGGFFREDSLSVNPASFIALSADTTATATPEKSATSALLTQTWHGGLSVGPVANITLASSLTLSQSVDGYSLVPDQYFATWLQAAQLVAPSLQGSDVLRNGTLTLSLSSPAAPLGFNLSASLAASRTPGDTESGLIQENDASLSAALNAKLGGEASDQSMSLTYGRVLSIFTAPSPGARFSAEAGELGRILALQTYLLEAAPIVEMFTDPGSTVLAAWQSAYAGTYTPSLALSYQRGFGSRLYDLFVPSSIQLKIQQDVDKSAVYSPTTFSIQPSTSTRAVNLFGSLGTYPLLSFVRTDDYSLDLSATINGGPGAQSTLSAFSADAYATLTGTEGNELTLLETVKWTETTTGALTSVFSSDTQALLDWKVFPAGGVPVPLIAAEIGRTAHWENRESFDTAVGYQSTGSFHALTITLGHATSLVFSTHGSIKAGLNLGLDAENLGASGVAWRLAVGAALEAKLTF